MNKIIAVGLPHLTSNFLLKSKHNGTIVLRPNTEGWHKVIKSSVFIEEAESKTPSKMLGWVDIESKPFKLPEYEAKRIELESRIKIEEAIVITQKSWSAITEKPRIIIID